MTPIYLFVRVTHDTHDKLIRAAEQQSSGSSANAAADILQAWSNQQQPATSWIKDRINRMLHK